MTGIERNDPPAATETMLYAMREFCETCELESNVVVEMVEVGILTPAGSHRAEWRFNAEAADRARRACRLQRDLGANLAGVAIALDLADELRTARRRIVALESQLAHFIDEH